jgi:uncharacterized protein (DUF1697 family)
MERFVAFLRAVNVGNRRVSMAECVHALQALGYEDVASYVNSGNLLFSAGGKPAEHEERIRATLEAVYGFEVTTFVRTAAQVRAAATRKPFGAIAAGHTHFALLPLTRLTPKEKQAAEALTNEHDTVIVVGRDIHWLIRSKSTETTLEAKHWKQALPANPTTARNTTMLAKLIERL